MNIYSVGINCIASATSANPGAHDLVRLVLAADEDEAKALATKRWDLAADLELSNVQDLESVEIIDRPVQYPDRVQTLATIRRPDGRLLPLRPLNRPMLRPALDQRDLV